MKSLVFILLTAWPSLAWPVRVVINNPTIQGKPIFAKFNNGFVGSETQLRANAVCRMAGYTRAVAKRAYGRDLIFTTSPVVQANTQIAMIDNFIDKTQVVWWMLHNGDFYEPATAGLINTTPKILTHKKVHPCAEVSVCRGYDPNDFWENGIKLDTTHPFVRACYVWGTSDKKEAQVFSSVTCETVESNKWQRETSALAQEWLAQNPQLKIVSGSRADIGAELTDAVATCKKYDRGVTGSLDRPEFGECNYSEPPANWGPQPIFATNTLFHFLLSTGRSTRMSNNLPVCAKQLLNTYASSVIPAEYGGHAQLVKQAFCVDSVAEIREDGEGCFFKVKTRDFLQAPGEIEVRFGSEDGSNKEALARCQAQASCFKNSGFSCEQSNFCPAPGMVGRDKK